MNKKILITAFMAACSLTLAFGFASCGVDGKDGKDGKDGAGIAKVEIIDGYLIITLTDGKVLEGVKLPELGNSDVQPTDSLRYQKIEGREEYRVMGMGTEANYEVVIPDTYRGLPVTEIGDNAFSEEVYMTSITIPASISKIGEKAFYECRNLSAVHISDIAKWCAVDFYDYGSNPVNYAANLYVNGTLLTELSIPGGVTAIGGMAFSNCSSLTKVTIPEGVTTIGASAFSGCGNLTSVSLPNSLMTLGNSAFSGCNALASVSLPSNVKTLGDSVFSSCSSLKNMIIPDGVTSIGQWAFSSCTQLESVSIGKNVRSIGDSAFQGCSALTSVSIPREGSLASIGNLAFYNCEKLRRIVIFSGVTVVGCQAFDGCNSLTIYCEAASKPSGWDVYWNDSNRPVEWGYKGE